jgi:hypothetical protein
MATSQTCCHLPGEMLDSAAEGADRARIGVYHIEKAFKLVKQNRRYELANLVQILLQQSLALSGSYFPPWQQQVFINQLFPSFLLRPRAVTCVIMQKAGAGLNTASACLWDRQTDGSCTVKWENNTIFCIVSVFGLAI